MKKIEKEIKKIFSKSTKYLSFILGLVVLVIVILFQINQTKVGQYIKDTYGEIVYNIFNDNDLIEKTSLKEDSEGKYLWYISEDSGRLEIVKEDKNYSIYIISNIAEEKIQIYPFVEIEKQNPNRLYKVTRVVDGDTIKIEYDDKQLSIRLIGVDTPESVHSDSNKNIPEGKIASEYTKSRLENKEVKLEFDVQPRDKYDRLLAYVYIDGEMFNKELLEKGYARVSTFPPNVKYVNDFTTIQKKAINNNKGFWDKNIWEEEK